VRTPGSRSWHGTPREQYLYAMRDRLFEVADRARYAFQPLGVMSEEQWRRLNEAELRWGDDIPLPRFTAGSDREYWSHCKEGDPVLLTAEAPRNQITAALPQGFSTTWRWLVLVRRGGIGTDHQPLPFDIVLRRPQTSSVSSIHSVALVACSARFRLLRLGSAHPLASSAQSASPTCGSLSPASAISPNRFSAARPFPLPSTAQRLSMGRPRTPGPTSPA
jgi:hypothetical protein